MKKTCLSFAECCLSTTPPPGTARFGIVQNALLHALCCSIQHWTLPILKPLYF